MDDYYIVSFSGGKDSTAMLLHLLELKQPINEVIFCDTYKEFPAMYRHIEKIKKVVEDNGILFTTLKNQYSYDYLMFDKEVKRRNEEDFIAKYGKPYNGYSWAGSRSRWCSSKLKIDLISKYLHSLRERYIVYQYIGLAADETKRLERKNNTDETHIHPLVEWGWSEKDCLNYCYSLGYDWEGLYSHFSRVSCWCCPLQSLDELRQLRRYYPDLWEELRDMDKRTYRTIKDKWSVEELEKRFAFEDERLAAGKSIRNREFYSELNTLLGRS